MDPQVQAAFRQLATSGAAVITALGIKADVDWVSIFGAIITIASFCFSLWSNRPKALVEHAAQSDQVVQIKMSDQATANSITSTKVTGPEQK